METRVPKAGRFLRRIRENLGLTVREVNARSRAISKRRHNPDYEISLTALSHIEAKGRVPHVYRLASLAEIYERSLDELLSLYRVPKVRSPKAADDHRLGEGRGATSA